MRFVLSLFWIVATALLALWIASQFASNSPCRVSESTSQCHGRRVGEANPLLLIALLIAWALIGIVLPRWYFRRRSSGLS